MKILLSIMFVALLIDIPTAQVPEPIHFTVTVSDTQLSSSQGDRVFTTLSIGMARTAKANC